MCSIDLEPCTVWEEATSKAIKTHECDACWDVIPKGAIYLRHRNLFDGRWTSEKMCADCWIVRKQFAEAHGQSITPSSLVEQLRDCIGGNDDPEDEWRPLLASVLKRYRSSPCRRARMKRVKP